MHRATSLRQRSAAPAGAVENGAIGQTVLPCWPLFRTFVNSRLAPQSPVVFSLLPIAGMLQRYPPSFSCRQLLPSSTGRVLPRDRRLLHRGNQGTPMQLQERHVCFRPGTGDSGKCEKRRRTLDRTDPREAGCLQMSHSALPTLNSEAPDPGRHIDHRIVVSGPGVSAIPPTALGTSA